MAPRGGIPTQHLPKPADTQRTNGAEGQEIRGYQSIVSGPFFRKLEPQALWVLSRLRAPARRGDDPRLGAARRVTIHGGFVVELLRALVQWGGLCPRLRRFALAASDKQKELELVNAC